MADAVIDTNAQSAVQTTTETAPVVQTTSTQASAGNQGTLDEAKVNAAIAAALEKADERAQKKAEGVFKSMLEQSKLNIDAETLDKMVEDYKKNQPTPENMLEAEKQKNQDLQNKLTQNEQEKIALMKGLPLGSDNAEEKEKVNACLTLAKSFLDDKTDFSAAIDRAMKIVSFEAEKPKAPPMYARKREDICDCYRIRHIQSQV
jgi:hypothetical protein